MYPNKLINAVKSAEHILIQCKEYVWQLKQQIDELDQSLLTKGSTAEHIEKRKQLLEELNILLSAIKNSQVEQKLEEAKALQKSVDRN